MTATELLVIFSAYLLGSIPTGYLIGAVAGVDVRRAGSGNVGATNVARVIGKRQGLLTLLADAAKGFIPVTLALQLHCTSTATALAGLAAFFGHLYPVFLKFHGGKGVATALGVLLAVAPAATLALTGIFAAVALASRTVSLGSMLAAAVAPLVLWALSYSPLLVGMSGVLAVMIILRHRANIRRLLDGSEPRFGT